MSFNKYRVFIRVADTKHMSKAAREMMYSQQAVSRIIKSLENEIGFKLVKKSRDGIKLTPEAYEILPTVREMIDVEDRLNVLLQAISARNEALATVIVGTSHRLDYYKLTELLPIINARCPELRIEVKQIAEGEDSKNLLKNGRLDCAIVPDSKSVDVTFIPIYTSELKMTLPDNGGYDNTVKTTWGIAVANDSEDSRGVELFVDVVKDIVGQMVIRKDVTAVTQK